MLRKVNIVYDIAELDDVDIISVPSEMADCIDDIAQEFFRWMELPENSRPFMVKSKCGHDILGLDTKEFIWWLNHVKNTDKPKAEIVVQHTSYNPQYPCAYF